MKIEKFKFLEYGSAIFATINLVLSIVLSILHDHISSVRILSITGWLVVVILTIRDILYNKNDT